MACGHQKVITKISACTDVSGFITKKACYSRGDAAQTKCVWTSYTTADGMKRTACGPCLAPGVGRVPAFAPGNAGPEPGSTVDTSSSQCDPPPTDSGERNATAEAEALRPVALESAGLRALEGSPHYVVVRVPEPHGREEYRKASEVAAAAAGWPVGAEIPTDAAFAVLGADPEDNKLPLIRTIAGSDTTNKSRRYVLPPPGILDMPKVVRIGMDNVTFNSTTGNNTTAANGDDQDAAGNATALALLLARADLAGQRRRLRLPGP